MEYMVDEMVVARVDDTVDGEEVGVLNTATKSIHTERNLAQRLRGMYGNEDISYAKVSVYNKRGSKSLRANISIKFTNQPLKKFVCDLAMRRNFSSVIQARYPDWREDSSYQSILSAHDQSPSEMKYIGKLRKESFDARGKSPIIDFTGLYFGAGPAECILVFQDAIIQLPVEYKEDKYYFAICEYKTK